MVQSSRQTGAREREECPHVRPKLAVTDFETVSVIGSGLVGEVYLVRRRSDERLYAMKVIPKKLLAQADMVQHAQAERLLQARVGEHPFLATLFGAFQDARSLYLIMEYVPGGDLAFHLASRVKLAEDVVHFIGAELCLALSHLHRQGIVHRDVKAANVLLDKEGHVRLTDFGMSKELRPRREEELLLEDGFTGASTYCGTRGYMAPEVLAHGPGGSQVEEAEGYGTSVDWWSYGVLLYEMLTGTKPFDPSLDGEALLQAMAQGAPPPPQGTSPAAASFVTALLDPDPRRRLSGDSVREHGFFAGLDWDALARKDLDPPWKPWCDDSDDEDVSNFPSDLTDHTPPTAERLGAAHPPMVGGDLSFEGFSYTERGFSGTPVGKVGSQEAAFGSFGELSAPQDRGGGRFSPVGGGPPLKAAGATKGVPIASRSHRTGSTAGGGGIVEADEDQVFGMSL